MKFTVEFDETELVDAIIAKLPTGGAAEQVVEEEDDFGGGSTKGKAEETITHETMAEKIGEAVSVHGKDAIKALVEKHAGVKKVADVPEEKRKAVVDAIGKLKPPKK